MDNGWIKLHRKLLNNPICKKPAWLSLWVTLLLMANHDKSYGFIWNGQPIQLEPGQFITGRKILSQETGIPQTTIEDILIYLETQHQIRQQKTTKYRLITILKWKQYQESDITSDNRATTERHIQEHNNIKNINTDAKASSNKKNMKTYNEHEHTGSDLPDVDLDTGEIVTPPKKTREPKNKVALSAVNYFNAKAFDNTGTKPESGSKGYFLVLEAINKAKLDSKLLKQRIDDWFSSGQPEEKLVQITHCFSNYSINDWKVKNSIK